MVVPNAASLGGAAAFVGTMNDFELQLIPENYEMKAKPFWLQEKYMIPFN